jgi:hypothetical protein
MNILICVMFVKKKRLTCIVNSGLLIYWSICISTNRHRFVYEGLWISRFTGVYVSVGTRAVYLEVLETRSFILTFQTARILLWSSAQSQSTVKIKLFVGMTRVFVFRIRSALERNRTRTTTLFLSRDLSPPMITTLTRSIRICRNDF